VRAAGWMGKMPAAGWVCTACFRWAGRLIRAKGLEAIKGLPGVTKTTYNR